MSKEVSEEKEKNVEKRLKIWKIRKLKAKNKLLFLLQIIGGLLRVENYILVFISLCGEAFGIESTNSILLLFLAMFMNRASREPLTYGIESDKQENYQEIIRLADEILEDTNEEEIRREK